jgi:hypothetical protein
MEKLHGECAEQSTKDDDTVSAARQEAVCSARKAAALVVVVAFLVPDSHKAVRILEVSANSKPPKAPVANMTERTLNVES